MKLHLTSSESCYFAINSNAIDITTINYQRQHPVEATSQPPVNKLHPLLYSVIQLLCIVIPGGLKSPPPLSRQVWWRSFSTIRYLLDWHQRNLQSWKVGVGGGWSVPRTFLIDHCSDIVGWDHMFLYTERVLADRGSKFVQVTVIIIMSSNNPSKRRGVDGTTEPILFGTPAHTIVDGH